MALAAAAVGLCWERLSDQLSLPDLVACTHICTDIRAALLKTAPAPWLLAARQRLPELQAGSVEEVLRQVRRAARALASLDSPSTWRHKAAAPIVTAALSSDGCWLAVAERRSLRVLAASSGAPKAALRLGKGRQTCTACFSLDSSMLLALSQGGDSYQLHSLQLATEQAAPGVTVFQEPHLCRNVAARCFGSSLAVSYSYEDAQYGLHLRGVLIDVRTSSVLQRVASPAAWRRLHEPSCLQACFAPNLALVAAIPAAAASTVVLRKGTSLQQVHLFELQQPASTLTWTDCTRLLVNGQQPWLAMLECSAKCVLWTQEIAQHTVVWPCLGSTHLLLETRQPLRELATSRQLWRVCKASGAKTEVTADWDLHSIRLRACVLHPAGCALAAVHQGPAKTCKAVLVRVTQRQQQQQQQQQQPTQLAEIESAAHPWAPHCQWSPAGDRLLIVGCRSVDVCDFAC